MEEAERVPPQADVSNIGARQQQGREWQAARCKSWLLSVCEMLELPACGPQGEGCGPQGDGCGPQSVARDALSLVSGSDPSRLLLDLHKHKENYLCSMRKN